eukprot:RCo012978
MKGNTTTGLLPNLDNAHTTAAPQLISARVFPSQKSFLCHEEQAPPPALQMEASQEHSRIEIPWRTAGGNTQLAYGQASKEPVPSGLPPFRQPLTSVTCPCVLHRGYSEATVGSGRGQSGPYQLPSTAPSEVRREESSVAAASSSSHLTTPPWHFTRRAG